MSDKSFVPNVEPPPHPSGLQNPAPLEGVASVPAAPYNPSGSISGQNLPPPGNPFATSPKKGIPRIAIFILIGLFVIIGVLLLIIAFRSKGSTTLVGTKGELVWWGVSNDEAVLKPLIEEFQNQNPNIKIIYRKQSTEDYRVRLTNALASGKGPDIFEIHNSWGGMFKNELSYAPTNILSREEFAKSFYPVSAIDLTNTSGVFGIPLEYDALTLFINEDIFTSALKTPPKTWIELATLAKENELTQRGANKILAQAGVALGITENVDYWPEIFALMMIQNGANLQKPGDDVTTDAIKFYTNFNKEIKSWDSTMPSSTSAFARGKLAMYFGTSRSVPEILKENPNLRFRTVVLPQLPKERPTDPDISYATYWAESVWKRSANTEVAWAFLKYLSSPQSLQKLNQNRKSLGKEEKVYPRTDMAVIQKEDEVLGSFVLMAPSAQSWFLAQNTFDGPTGINSQINSAYESVITAATDGKDFKKEVAALPGKIDEIINKFTPKR